MENVVDAYALTSVQQGILFHVLESDQEGVYVSTITMTVRGALDIARFQSAWARMISSHESLRASFLWDGLDDPVQVIHSAVEPVWSIESCTTETERAVDVVLHKIVGEERATQFALDNAPLIKFRLVELASDEHILIWTIHHLLADGWCTPLMLDEVMTFYSGTEQANSLSTRHEIEYSDYVHWRSSQLTDDVIAYWKRHLQKAKTTPLKLVRPVQHKNGQNKIGVTEIHSVDIATDQTAAIELFCRRNAVTLNTLFHATWSLVLRDYCASDRPLFGTVVSGRQGDLPGIDRVVGLLLSTLPISVPIDQTQKLDTWLSEWQTVLARHSDNCHVPLTELRSTISDAGQGALFDTVIAMESHSHDMQFVSADGQLSIENIDYFTPSSYPLTLLVQPGRNLRVALQFDSNRFFHNHIQACLDRLINYVDALVHNSFSTIGDLLSLPRFDHQVMEYSKGRSSLPSRPKTIHGWFESTVDACSDRTALIFKNNRMPFLDVDRAANQLAHYIHAKTSAEEALIGVILPRGLEQIIAILSVLKTGKAYVPLSCDIPVNRLQQIIDQTGIATIIAAEYDLSTLVSKPKKIEIGDSKSYPSTRLQLKSEQQGELAYVMFTSGSTGQPKGVKISHSNLVYSTLARINYYDEPEPTFLLLSSYTFDSSVAGIYWSLCGGGVLVLPEPDQEKDIADIESLVQENSVTHTLMLPSLYKLILDYTAADAMNSLRAVLVAGEQCSHNLIRQHYESRSGTKLFNEYGPTECTVWCTAQELQVDENQLVSIGHPIGESIVLVLDSNGRPCPVGVEGEIYIGGDGVGLGYWQQEALTSERFIDSPYFHKDSQKFFKSGDRGFWSSPGRLVFTGRVDRQIKIRGFRIEPAEIEAVLTEFPGVQEAAVVQESATDADSRRDNTIEYKLSVIVRELSTMSLSEQHAILDWAEEEHH